MFQFQIKFKNRSSIHQDNHKNQTEGVITSKNVYLNAEALLGLSICPILPHLIDEEEQDLGKIFHYHKVCKGFLDRGAATSLDDYTFIVVRNGCTLISHMKGYIHGGFNAENRVSEADLQKDPSLQHYIELAVIHYWMASENGHTIQQYELYDHHERLLKTLNPLELAKQASILNERVPQFLTKFTSVYQKGFIPSLDICHRCHYSRQCAHKDQKYLF